MRHNSIVKHFATFYSPGTLVAETTQREVPAWDAEEAKRIAATIAERYGATPYGFQFTTVNWESKETARSPMYYLPHCKVETLAEIEARNLPNESILRSNMLHNGWDRIVTITTGWMVSLPLKPSDIVLA